jgi:hypothetical protein
MHQHWERQVHRWEAWQDAADAVHDVLPQAIAVLKETLQTGEPKARLTVALALLRWASITPQAVCPSQVATWLDENLADALLVTGGEVPEPTPMIADGDHSQPASRAKRGP